MGDGVGAVAIGLRYAVCVVQQDTDSDAQLRIVVKTPKEVGRADLGDMRARGRRNMRMNARDTQHGSVGKRRGLEMVNFRHRHWRTGRIDR